MNEEWRPVEMIGMAWPYEVSNQGSVRRSEPGHGTYVGRPLTPITGQQGYLQVTLCKPMAGHGSGIQVIFRVHQLVAEAFIGPRPDGYVVNHKDHDRANPNVLNLEYVSSGENRITNLSKEQIITLRSELDELMEKYNIGPWSLSPFSLVSSLKSRRA